MNRIDTLFKEKKNILSIYFTAGFPKLEDTNSIVNELEKAGADMIEIGIPFSDPLADGTVIQHSNEVALKNGMSLKLLFKQLSTCPSGRRAANCWRPLAPPTLLMGYLNPVLQFGVENFCKEANDVGISGIILPDLPVEEYLAEYKSIFEKYNLKNIFLITPQTTKKRITYIDEHSDGFIYVVSSSSTTGTKPSIFQSIAFNEGLQKKSKVSPEGGDLEGVEYFSRIKSMKLKNPLMIGFGISDKQSFSQACEYANGAIIGSAFIKQIEKTNSLKKSINDFLKSVR